MSLKQTQAKRERTVNAVGWIGSLFGLIGSLLLALNMPISGLGFLAYLVSNVAWLYHGFTTRTWSMCVMQIGFTATSFLGVFNWIIK